MTAAVLAFPCPTAMRDALCRKLFQAYEGKTSSLRQRDWASLRRYQLIYDATLRDLAAIGMEEHTAFRIGARG
jgi:hypothetical protein